MSMENIIQRIREFRDARDWRQFHNPKDMAIAISVESAELLEHFLWKTNAEVEKRIAEKMEQVSDEIADIGIYLFELSDILGIDLIAAMERKLGKNAAKYPVEKARGSNKKYTEL
ncbi:MAG: nucleotide pyrophosphohydrolase [Verrucomicrobia bacterium]|nr:nucleotide pyrophosphohydrolase [Verrucomicrobiota bacterium]